MNIDLENMSLKELRDLQKAVGRQIDGFEAKKKEKAMAAAQQAAEEHGFSLKDLLGGGKSVKSTVAPKYTNPEDASSTWTGRGRQPLWVKGHLDAGGNLDDLLIK
ncbi:H-NS family nucleoid-associated regulatory protein [Paracoccus nototheniae]|uniref:H-NS family nucleoid-associated regulatory protein n=1 Tax=Paracoccus nototheniae TaxID=2489002 RepID=A0ABW4E3X1_9RHOB|nr:H-NS histone family protein [Paracoccus nototheniae]